MADSIDVPATLKLVYTIYEFIAISLIGCFKCLRKAVSSNDSG